MKNDYSNINNSTSSSVLSTATSSLAATAAAANESTSEEHSKLTIAVLGVLYSLIFLIGITGNSLGKNIERSFKSIYTCEILIKFQIWGVSKGWGREAGRSANANDENYG